MSDPHPVCPICTDGDFADLDVDAGLRPFHTCPSCGAVFAVGDDGPEIVSGPRLPF